MIFYDFFFIFIGLLLLRKKEYCIVLLPIFNVILDSAFTYFPTLSIVTFIRPVLFLILFILIIKKISFNTLTGPLYIYLLYTFILVFFSTEIFYSFKGYMQVFISMMTFIAGFFYFDHPAKLDALNRSVLLVLVFSVIAVAVGYVFGIGRLLEYTQREEEPQSIGLLGSSGLYSAAVVIGILPLVITSFKKRFWKWVLYISAIIAFIFILLNVRRTAIFIPVVGLLTFAWFSTKKSKIISGIIVAIGILLALSPYYQDRLFERYQVREEHGRFNKDFYKTEGRYLENITLYPAVFSFEDPVKSLFGSAIYASGREEVDGKERGRMYHSDTASLLAGTGIIGLLLYIYFYISLFRYVKLFYSSSIPKHKLYKVSYYSLLFISLFASLNGSILIVPLRSLIFLYMGALLSLMYNSGVVYIRQQQKKTSK